MSRLDVALHEIKTLSGSKVLPDNFVHYEKKEMTSSDTWSERLQYFSLRLKYNRLHERASFSCVTLEIFIFYYVCVIIPRFSKHKRTKYGLEV